MFYAGTLSYTCYLAQSINKYEMILKKAGKDAHVEFLPWLIIGRKYLICSLIGQST